MTTIFILAAARMLDCDHVILLHCIPHRLSWSEFFSLNFHVDCLYSLVINYVNVYSPIKRQVSQRSKMFFNVLSLLHLYTVNSFKYSLLYLKQESPADAVKPARRKIMPKLLQFDVFRFISPNFISQNCQCIASRLGSRPI